MNSAADFGELKWRNHMQKRIQVVSGHRFQLRGIDVGSWARGISLAAAKPKTAPLNKGFQLTAQLSGKVVNGLRFWETRLYPQSKKSPYFRDVQRGGHTPTSLLSHKHICLEGRPTHTKMLSSLNKREWLVITESSITQWVYSFVRLLM